MILVLDNYDSFTFNLVQMLEVRGMDLELRHHDDPALLSLSPGDYSGLLVGPGPGRPEEAGACLDLLKTFLGEVPTLGICLGHQALGMLLGGGLSLAPEPMHGRVVPIHHGGEGLFMGLPSPIQATRYHSLVVDRESLGPEAEVTAWTEDGLVMGISANRWRATGLQFHPESVASEGGGLLMDNFLEGLR